MVTVALTLLAAALQKELPRDSAEIIQSIRYLVGHHYTWKEAIRETGPPYAGFPEWWVPAPRRQPVDAAPATCEAESLMPCLGGDWTCRHPVDCTDPLMFERRARLIDFVEAQAPMAGGSALVFRQRVALALKNGEPERATRIAQSCYGTEWWCLALRGLTEHRLSPGAGLAQFDSALNAAPDSVACGWRDVTILMSNPQRTTPVPCSDDKTQEARFWWLADPLWSRTGNERQAEHYARHVLQQMDRDLRFDWVDLCDPTVYLLQGIPNSLTVRDIRRPDSPLARHALHVAGCTTPRSDFVWASPAQLDTYYGFRANPGPRDHVLTSIRYVHGGYDFAPDSSRWRDPLASTSDDWAVYWDRGRDRLITGEKWYNLQHQTAVFRRGSKLRIASAALLPAPLRGEAVHAYLALGRIDDLHTEAKPARMDGRAIARAEMTVDAADYVASIEIVSDSAIGRARHGARAQPLQAGFGVSDIAIVDERFEADQRTLVDALLPTTALSRALRAGIYFELYGISHEESLEVRLESEPLERSLLQRVFGTLRLSSRNRPLRVKWMEDIERSVEPVPRFFILDVREIPTGTNRLSLIVTRPDGTSARATRIVRVLAAGACSAPPCDPREP